MSRSKKSFKLVVIDRDGTINTLREGFTRVPEEFVAVPGALEAVALLNRAGWHVVVATNQPGLGRGLFDVIELNAVQRSASAVATDRRRAGPGAHRAAAGTRSSCRSAAG